jgi:DNA modification methylase
MDGNNKLYFGDNLKILREYLEAASVDLVYLDPPFNSNATYNVLFKEKSGEESAAQQSVRGQGRSDATRRLFDRLIPRHGRSKFTHHKWGVERVGSTDQSSGP